RLHAGSHGHRDGCRSQAPRAGRVDHRAVSRSSAAGPLSAGLDKGADAVRHEHSCPMTALDRFRGAWRDGWFVVPYHVMFADVDAYGHVNNAVYFKYFEWGRIQL